MEKFGFFLAITLLVTGALAGCKAENTIGNNEIEEIRQEDVIRDYPVNSNNIVMNQEGDSIYIANIDVNTVSIVDVQTKEVLNEIPVGNRPKQLTLSPDEKLLYVACMFDNRVDIISLEKNEVVDSIVVGIEPFGIITSQDGKLLYTANYRSGTVSVIDLTSKNVLKEIEIGDRPRTLTITANGEKIYVPHYLDAKISVIHTADNVVQKVIALDNSPDKTDVKQSQGIPNTLEQFVIAPDGKTAWVPHLLTNVDTPIHFQETIFPAISIIDLEKDEEMVDVRKELFEEINVTDKKDETIIISNPYDVAFHPDGSKVYAIMSGSEDLVVFDLKRGGNATQILRRIEGDNPRGIVASPDGEYLFVHNAMSHDLSSLETGGESSYARVKMSGENLPLIQNDPLSPLVREGKAIFYSGNSDEYAIDITGNNWMSCASCHSDGEINGLTLMTPKGQRNVPSNVFTTKTGLFMWDGSRDDFTDYIHTVQDEMGGMMELDPGEPIPEDIQHMYDALFAFLDEPTSFPPPQSPYLNEDGTLTSAAQEGQEIFQGKANCLSCHGGEYFTDSVKAINESGNLTTDNTEYLHDIGTSNEFDVSSEGDDRANFTNPRNKNHFDTPTLRGAWATAPYLHDGSAETIEEAIKRHQSEEISALTNGEVLKIAQYVRSIE